MTSPSPVSVLRAGALSDAEADQVDEIVADAAAADGAGPLSEEARLRLRGAQDGGIHLLLRGPDDERIVGYAQLAAEPGDHDARAELVVAPGYRRRRLGRALASALLEDANGRTLHVWAHGDHPGARRLADECGFVRERDLWQMRRPLDQPVPEPQVPADLAIRAFVPGQDEAAWLAVNAAAFASHPEQGSWTERDLRLREEEPWFDPAGFFLAERGGQLVGFHWTKVHPATPVEPALGEVYVLGVLPSEAGRGLGGLLTLIGLRHLQAVGLGTVLLYVEATNAAAVAVYKRLGFTRYAVDVSYRSARGEGLPAAGSRLGRTPVAGTGTVLAEVDMTDSTTSPDVVDILTIDHREVLDLIQQIKGSTSGEQKRDLTDTVIAELVRHSVAEEMYVYPAMKEHLPNGAEAVQHDTSEHKELEREMKTLESLDANSEEFLEAIGKLEATLRDHVSDEEDEHFPALRNNVPHQELVKMAGAVEQAKKIAPTRPHPNAPNDQLFHKLVGPGVGLVDRLRDRLSGRNG